MIHRTPETDPLRNFKFQVEIPHVVPAPYNRPIRLGFMAASGLASTTEPISYREGGDNTTPRKMPGQSDFPPISLTRGMVGSAIDKTLLWQWYREIFFVVQGQGLNPGPSHDFRSDIYIRVLHHPVTRGTPQVAASWKAYNCWPSALAFSDLDAGGNGVMVTNLTLMNEGFDHATANIGDNRLAAAW